MAADAQTRVVFLSYAREDLDLRHRLEVVLTPLVRKGRLELWADNQIGPSRVWNDEIELNLSRAELAVLREIVKTCGSGPPADHAAAS